MINPLTNMPLAPEAAEKVEKLRTVRRNARKDARSGNPAVRYPAKRARALAAVLLRRIYVGEARR